MSSLIDIGYTNWIRFLTRLALFTGLVYLGLMLAFIILVLPASQNSPLPVEFFELVAASRNPLLYRLTIVADVASWLALAGLLIAFAALFSRRAPIRSTLIAASGVALVSGYIGACFRLAGTSDLASLYLAATPDKQAAILQSYLDLLRLINVLFSAGGLLGGFAIVLAASVAWSIAEFPRWVIGLLGLAGFLQISKSVVELTTRADLGPLALLGNILLIIALFAIARKFWRSVLPDQMPLTS